MRELLSSKLVNEQLSSVEFVQDYLQLHFDGPMLTTYVWPEVSLKQENYIFGDKDYRNKLCELIGFEIGEIHYENDQFLELFFKKEQGWIKLNLDPKNPEIVAEIAIFSDSLDNTWVIFE